MRFLLFSDIHFHEFTENAKLVSYSMNDGRVIQINSRLRDCAMAMRQVADYAEKSGITHIFFAGDLFHSKRHVTKTIYNVIVNELTRPKKVTWHLLCGNHDMVSADGLDNSLVALKYLSNVRVFDHNTKTDVVLDQDRTVRLIPFTEDKNELKKLIQAPITGPTVLILHAGVQGAKLGSDFVLSKDYDIELDDISSNYEACFLGHYHEHQELRPGCWYIGATHQHNWGDSGSLRGFLEISWTDTVSFTRHYIQAPKHVVINQGDDLSVINPGDFVNYVVGSEEELPAEIKALSNVKTTFSKAEGDKDAFTLSEFSSDDEACKAWVNAKCKDSAEAKELLAFGLDLLKD